MPNDIQHKLRFSENRVEIFKNLPINEQGFILLGLPKSIQRKIIKALDIHQIIKMLHYLDPDETARLLRNVDKALRDNIIEKLSSDIREKVEFLLRFNPNSAAALMNLNYVEIDENSSFKEVAQLVKRYEEKTKKFPEILVVKKGFFVGELEGHFLFFHKGEEKIKKYIKKIPTIQYNKSQKEIIDLFRKNPKKQVVVLDDDRSILGVIYSADVLQLVGKERAKELSLFAGVQEQEDVNDSAFLKVRNRYKWLIINLGTAFLASLVVSFFQEDISRLSLLAVYMPIVAGMGGNSGTQTLAVMVRGLTLKEIAFNKQAKKAILNEVIAGGINGLINGLIVALVASFFNKNPLLGLIVGIAMIVNLMIAGFFGSIIPLIMKKIGKDPACSATVFITTATDVCGFFVFLGLASLVF